MVANACFQAHLSFTSRLYWLTFIQGNVSSPYLQAAEITVQSIIYHFSSLCLIQSQARCLVDWKRAFWEGEKLMYIHIPTNELSREALKSGLLWIGFVNRVCSNTSMDSCCKRSCSICYQGSHCQSFCCAWVGKCGRKSHVLSWEACTWDLTRVVPFVFLLPCHKAESKGLACGCSGKCL